MENNWIFFYYTYFCIICCSRHWMLEQHPICSDISFLCWCTLRNQTRINRLLWTAIIFWWLAWIYQDIIYLCSPRTRLRTVPQILFLLQYPKSFQSTFRMPLHENPKVFQSLWPDFVLIINYWKIKENIRLDILQVRKKFVDRCR